MLNVELCCLELEHGFLRARWQNCVDVGGGLSNHIFINNELYNILAENVCKVICVSSTMNSNYK